jgi:gliding motility-associated-like protein
MNQILHLYTSKSILFNFFKIRSKMKRLGLFLTALAVIFILNSQVNKIYGQATILISTGGTVAVHDGDNFYDAGGLSGVDGNTNYTITLTPAVSGESVCLDFTTFNTYYDVSALSYAYGDSVCIFDGSNTSASKIATLTGNYGVKWNNGTVPTPVGIGTANGLVAVTSPGIFCSTNASGSLTISFYNVDATTSPGWVAKVVTYISLGNPGCNISLTANPNPICAGTSTTLTATGNIISAAINNNFNGSVGTGWVGSPSASIVTSVCSKPSLDGSQYLWMQNYAAPRSLESLSMDVANGGTVSYEYRNAAINSDASPCEAPDINSNGSTPEAVFLQYSTNNGSTWSTMKVMFPYNVQNHNMTGDNYNGCGYEVGAWHKIVVPIPTAARTASTKFRWIMPICTSASTDNWGLDNAVIASPKTVTITLKDVTNNTILGTSTTSPYTFAVTPSATTIYESTISDGTTSCTSQVTVTVNTCGCTPPVANAGTDATITCTSNSSGVAIGSASVAGVSYAWSPTTGLSSSTVSNPTANPTSTATYTLTATNTAGGGCTATDQVIVTVNKTVPTASAGTDGTISCSQNVSGLNIGTTSVAGVSYTWSPTAGLSSSSASNPTANPTGTTTYTLTATNTASGCTASDQVVITVNKTVPTANAGTDGTISCTQNTSGLAIGSASVAGVTYSWSPSTGLSSATVSNPTANPTGTTTYTLTTTNTASGCTASDQVVVTVSSNTATANAGTDGTISCTQNTSGLAIGSASVAGTTYSWSPTTGLSSATVSNPTANPTGTTTYTLTATNTASGCTASDQVIVTVNKTVPTANAGTDGTISCTQNASGLAIGSASVAGVTYSWSPSTGLSSATVSNPTANPTGTSTYILTVTNTASGCTASDQVVVTVNLTTPTASAGTDGTISCTQNASGLAIGSASVAGVTYSWSPSTGLSSATVSNPTANPTGTFTYTLTATNTASGCTASDQVVVSVNKTTPTANAGADQNITCASPSAQLNGSGSSTGANYSYTWSGVIFSGGNTNTPTVNQTGTYTLTVTDNTNGCSASDNVIVTSTSPIPVANAGSDKIITCSTLSVILDGSASSTGANYSYSWSGTLVSGAGTLNPTVNQAGSYTLTVSDNSNGCSSIDNVIVTLNNTAPTANAGPDQNITCASPSIQLDGSASSSGSNYSYTWSGTLVSGAGTQTPIVNQVGTYTITVTNTTNGCTATDEVTISTTNGPTFSSTNTSDASCNLPNGGATVTVTGGSPPYSCEWDSNPVQIGQTLANVPAGNYTATVTDAVGCTIITSVTIGQISPPVGVTSSTEETCRMGNGTATVVASQGTGNYSYFWSTNPQQISATATNLHSGNYTVTVDDGNCSIQLQTHVSSILGPEASFTPTPRILTIMDGPVTFIDNSTGNIVNWQWEFGDGNTLTGQPASHSYSSIGTYTITLSVTDDNGCKDFATDTVKVKEIYTFYIPNSFSPNGDGKNDFFFPQGLSIDPDNYNFTIFDRWGNIVFNTTEIDGKWNGTHRNNGISDDCVIGVYVYYIEAKEINGKQKIYSGKVTLVR